MILYLVLRLDIKSAIATLSIAREQPEQVEGRTYNHIQGGRAAGIHWTTAKEL